MTGSKTKIEVMEKALKELIQKYKLRAIKNYKGKVNLDVDLNVVKDRSENFKR